MNQNITRVSIALIITLTLTFHSFAQVMTPEKLWQLERISPVGITEDGEEVIFTSNSYDIAANNSSSKTFRISIDNGITTEIDSYIDIYKDPKISPNGKHKIISKKVKLSPVLGKDHYPKMEKSNVYIYESLNYRHWDTWEDGTYNHIFLKDLTPGSTSEIDIMEGEPYYCPLKPFGGENDFVWNNDGTKIIYVALKEFGTAYAKSTNTDIYLYDLATKTTTNLTQENKGYDKSPAYSKDGTLAWLQMEEPGNEADKNDLIILKDKKKINLTEHWDGTVNSFLWSNDGNKIFFIAPVNGTKHVFEIKIPRRGISEVKQISFGDFDITSLIGESKNTLVVTRTDMNHAAEIYKLNLKSGEMNQLSHVNDLAYKEIKLSMVERRIIPTTDGKEMLTWVIYPPEFDPSKKYPTLLYCQGGPQSPLTQFYSFRWNFQLMAANGYIIVAPNRRGMPGYGVEWNAQISGDWGGQNIQDYLSAIDALAKEPYVDKNRLGCVGASYGGYSVFYLAGMHQNRFKSFIAHDGIFNTQSMYGTTEELFFVNKDFEGPYWQNPTPRSYTDFNPINLVDRWNTPILIIQGGKDYRVPIGQGLEAFQAAQLRGIKSKLLFFPDENHWILSAQNGIIWQREFYKWLAETL